jgi:hypothetical protein
LKVLEKQQVEVFCNQVLTERYSTKSVQTKLGKKCSNIRQGSKKKKESGTNS